MHAITRRLLIDSLGEEHVCRTAIPYADIYKRAINLRKPITFHAPQSEAAQLVSRLAAELIMPVQLSHRLPCPTNSPT